MPKTCRIKVKTRNLISRQDSALWLQHDRDNFLTKDRLPNRVLTGSQCEASCTVRMAGRKQKMLSWSVFSSLGSLAGGPGMPVGKKEDNGRTNERRPLSEVA
jgi:hypothetical protein